jgi:hypothetical protein
MNQEPIKVKLVGGLGNQLFIWATAFVISKKNHYSISFDATACQQWGCELERFGIKIDIKPTHLSGVLPGKSSSNKTIDSVRFIRNKFRNLRIGKYYWERDSIFDPSIFSIKPGKVLCGYFQSYKYFIGFENEIQRELIQGFQGGRDYIDLLNELDGSQWVAIHVRRQDYVLMSETFGLTSETYFEESIRYVESLFPGIKKIAFSDDVTEARKILPCCDMYIGHNELASSVETLILMSNSSAIIGSNSSFSWWAAFLSNSPDDCKIFPEPWFRDESIDTSGLVPPTWQRIKN